MSHIENSEPTFDVAFGSAHLFVKQMRESVARGLLLAAIDAGATRLDTAPLYGYGLSEALVSLVVSGNPDVKVTTKVGLEPGPVPAAWRMVAGRLARRVPGVAEVAERIRGTLRSSVSTGADAQSAGPSGRFQMKPVRDSIERSLRMFGHVDRLLLHEVHPADINDSLLRLLDGFQRRGDVGRLGVATGNAVTAIALRKGHGLFTVAHISADACKSPLVRLLQAAAAVEGQGLTVVGHGVLGAEGRTLSFLSKRLAGDARLAQRWHEAVDASRFSIDSGVTDSAEQGRRYDLAGALCARAAAQGFDELLVATSKASRVRKTVQAAASARSMPLPSAAVTVLDEIFGYETPACALPVSEAESAPGVLPIIRQA